jgi:hypothetical protein
MFARTGQRLTLLQHGTQLALDNLLLSLSFGRWTRFSAQRPQHVVSNDPYREQDGSHLAFAHALIHAPSQTGEQFVRDFLVRFVHEGEFQPAVPGLSGEA